MIMKSDKDKVKTGKKVIDSSARCITCNKTCSMSGLCMKPWPEFKIRGVKGDINDDKDIKKSS